MVKRFVILLLPLVMQSQVMWQIKKDTVQTWYYGDGDEFNAQSLDAGKWRSGMPWGNFVMSQDLYFSKDNLSQHEGIISFDAKKEQRTFPIMDHEVDKNYLQKSGQSLKNGQYEVAYTCGMISSLKKFRYGLFELRFKSTANTGIWPAFWLYGGEPNEEIDFFELKGERKNQLHVDVHCPDGCENYRGGFLDLRKNWGGWISTQGRLSDGWNILSGEWQPGYVKWFLNGQPIAYYKGDFKTSQYLFLNTSVAATGGGFSPGPDESTQWPNHFEVDYVRVWSKEDTVVSKVKNDAMAFEQSLATIDSARLYNTFLKKKLKYVYNDKALRDESGTVTLLPLGNGRYSLSLVGKDLGPVTLEVKSAEGNKQIAADLANVQYYILNLQELSTGTYTLEVHVGNQTLRHEIPVTHLNPLLQR